MNAFERILKSSDLLLAVGIITIVVMLVLPLPEWLLDAALIVSIGSSLAIALIATNISHPLEFSTFPSVLLITTLLRLALSIAATKLILGTASAGYVIQTFGNFVMGGDFVVGLVAFSILVIVQFVVITNGAGRVAEVVARFTLDAMPGKQMSIDADLNAGLITEQEAKARREEIKREADFYGAMDGASKFIRGDAIAAVLIILVNIIGGLIVGSMRGEGGLLNILRTYALLSVGEGLVSQIPALLISTSAGLMVTRSGQDSGMGSAVFRQVFSQPKALLGTSAALAALAFVPGFPTITFLCMAVIAYGSYRFAQGFHLQKSKSQEGKQEQPQTTSGPDAVMPLLNVDPIEIEVGYALTKIADPRQGGDLPQRITALRRQLVLEMGFVMPSVRIRDSIELSANEYRIKIRGEEIANGKCYPDKILAIDSGNVINPLVGTKTIEPVFGIEAMWIEKGQREQAERSGYMVVEPSAMMCTHLSEIVKAHAAELLSRQDVQNLLDNLKEKNPALVEDLVPSKMTVGDIQKVLQHLLRERIPIRDLVTILETVADFADRTKEPDQLGELARAAIARTISRLYANREGKLACITLDPTFTHAIQEHIQHTPYGATLALEPEQAQKLAKEIAQHSEKAIAEHGSAVVLTTNSMRLPLKRLLERYRVQTPILAFNEVVANVDVEFVGQVAA
ncbi:MAG TPA: flagellar biosynthesis protein FlhA [Fimbriimonadales bacterium]|nr:flagellar biosynthesis protein FlhA [Fimbriimonadales bacterium]